MTSLRVRAAAVVASSVLACAALAVPQAAQAAKPTYKVTVESSGSAARAGDDVTLSGKVRKPKARNKTVKVQQQVGGSWKVVARTKLTQKSRYSVDVPVGTTSGFQRFRVVKPGSKAAKKGISSTVTVRVVGGSSGGGVKTRCNPRDPRC
jgi:hypothetical protein